MHARSALAVLAALALCTPAAALNKVFGVGLSKTGTTSLGTALALMGYRNLHHDFTLVRSCF